MKAGALSPKRRQRLLLSRRCHANKAGSSLSTKWAWT